MAGERFWIGLFLSLCVCAYFVIRRRYEKGHWDAVIKKYKEIELHDESFDGSGNIPEILERTRQHLAEHHLDYAPIAWLPCHAIDLKKDGELNAHVDSVRFSGDLVAGLSLLSPSIMRLIPDNGEDDDTDSQKDPAEISKERGHVDLFLPPQSLYALTGVGRYKYSHQLLPDNSIFQSLVNGKEIVVKRDHRLSVIFRDSKRE
mmetsp:Transcript_28916/g.54340  ORF Transcript_28916/g.54340 Transcript_28916/m.54340 type:complete len:203 (+) Transcript_28916:19-627(+)